MHDNRPLFKRQKFVACFICMCIVALAIIGNVVAQALAQGPAVDAGSMAILMSSVPIAIGMFQHATGKVDTAKAMAAAEAYKARKS